MANQKLVVKNFAQIREAQIDLGDLTVLVGPQATGKSLLLQLLKLALDGREIIGTLRVNGLEPGEPADLLNLYLGEGMATAWRQSTSVSFAQKEMSLETILGSRAGSGPGSVFYVPAHRALTLVDGWPRPFLVHPAATPFVARLFSEQIYLLLNGPLGQAGHLFPIDRRLRASVRRTVDQAIFHGGNLVLTQVGRQRQLGLQYGRVGLSFMSWTAGQREFIPLLLGLYHLMPLGNKSTADPVRTVVIEEPELGLHPQAVRAAMLLVLELLCRGYRVLLSTHSPLVLDIVWALRNLRAWGAAQKHVLHLFELPMIQEAYPLARTALNCDYRAFYLDYDKKGQVYSADISELDPGSEDDRISGWGGLTAYSGKVGEVVAAAANERDRGR